MLKRFKLQIFAAILMAMSLNACSTLYGGEESPDPIGISTDPEELKRSPCACNEVPQDYNAWKKSV